MHATLIWLDCLPYGLPGCCGNTRIRTPGFDRFAAGCVTFDNCFADDLRGDGNDVLLEALTSLSERDVSVDVIAAQPTRLTARLNSDPHVDVGVTMLEDAAALADRAVKTAASSGGQQQGALSVVSLADVVGGLTDSPDETLSAADELIGRLADGCRPVDNLILITAARGRPAGVDGRALYEREIHVPLLGRLGSARALGVRCASLVKTGDVSATLLDCLCSTAMPISTRAGSLRRALAAEPAKSRERLVLRGDNNRFGLRTPDWYLITTLPPEEAIDPELQTAESAELYIKPDDCWDRLNVAAQSPQVVEHLVRVLLQDLGESGAPQ